VNRRMLALSAMVAVLTCTLLAVNLRRAALAKESSLTSRRAYVQTANDASEIRTLRSRRPQIAASEQPTRDIIARINDVLHRCQLDGSVFSSLTPESDVKLDLRDASGATYRRQSLRLSMSGLQIPELGSFLGSWRLEQPLWTVSRIELNHARESGKASSNYDVALLLSSIYVSNE